MKKISDPTLKGKPSPERQDELRAHILDFLGQQDSPVTIAEIAGALGCKWNKVSVNMKSLQTDGLISRCRKAVSEKYLWGLPAVVAESRSRVPPPRTVSRDSGGILGLMAGVLSKAVSDLQAARVAGPGHYRAEWQWFASTDDSHIFSFASICQHLDLNSTWMREKIQQKINSS